MIALGYNFWSEWELQEKVNFDGSNKIIKVYPHVTDLDIRADVWSAAVRWLAMLNRGYDRYLEPMERTGLDPIPNGQTGDSYFLQNGWKLVVDFSKVRITGVLFSRDFESAYYTEELGIQFAAQVASIVNTVTTVQNVVTGDLSSVQDIVSQIQSLTNDLHKRLDLDVNKPNTYANDASDIPNDDFTLTKTDNGDGTSTVQRS